MMAGLCVVGKQGYSRYAKNTISRRRMSNGFVIFFLCVHGSVFVFARRPSATLIYEIDVNAVCARIKLTRHLAIMSF